MKTISSLILVLVVLCCGVKVAGADQTSELSGRIAFLKGGELCLSDRTGGNITPVTNTGGEVDDFLFSPTWKYLAVTKTCGYTEGIGYFEDDEEVPQEKVFSVVVLTWPAMDTLTEIVPEEGWLNLAVWSSPSKLMCTATSGYDVFGFLEYDASTDTRRWVEYHEAHPIVYGNYSDDGELWSYTDYTGLGESLRDRLHLVDRTTGADTVLFEEPKLFFPSISHDKTKVAVVETRKSGDQTFDNIWVYDPDKGEADSLCSWPMIAKSDGRLSWSTNDSCLGVFYWGTTRAVTLSDPTNVHTVKCWGGCWLEDGGLLSGRGDGIHLYDLRAKTDRLLIDSAKAPVWVR